MHDRKRKAPTTSTVFTKKTKLATPPQSEDFGIRMIHRGLKDLFKIYRASFKRVYNDIAVVTTMLFAHMVHLLELMVREKDGIKAHLRLVLPIFRYVYYPFSSFCSLVKFMVAAYVLY